LPQMEKLKTIINLWPMNSIYNIIQLTTDPHSGWF